MVNLVSNTSSLANMNTRRVFNSRHVGVRPPMNVPALNTRTGVELNISDEGRIKSQMLFELQQSESIGMARHQTIVDYNGNLTPENSVDFSLFSREAISFLTQSQTFFDNAWSAENIIMAEMGYRLTSVFDFNEDNTHNFVALANRYAEMWQHIKEQFSGEEQVSRLSVLSQAFDLSVNIQAEHRYLQTRIGLSHEMLRISAHNQLIQPHQLNPPSFFEGGRIEIGQDEFSSILASLTAGVREAVSHFSHLTRQFVLENGMVNTEQEREILEAFLQNAERPVGFTIDDLNAINKILSRPFPNGRENNMASIESRNESIFSELLRRFPDLRNN